MKTIKTNDGLITLTAFEFSDLKGDAREKALADHYTFLTEVNEVENESGEMEWQELEYDEEYIIENIDINGYLFDLHGDILPVVKYVDNHHFAGQSSIKIFGEEKFCDIL